MNNWRRLGIAGLAAGALTMGAFRADAACIDSMTNTVSNPADCLFGDGGDTDTCRLAISVDMDGAGTPPADPKKITCVDGAACDADGAVNGSCTFRVGACINLAGCTATNVTAGTVVKPGSKDVNNAFKYPSAVTNNQNLQDALDALLPSAGAGVCTDPDVAVKVDLSSKGGICTDASGPTAGAKCVSDLDCSESCMPTMKKAKANVSLTVTDSGGDSNSKFKLTCVPAEGAFANGAAARQIASASDLIGGPLAMGRVGDYLIRNGNIRAVVRAPGRQHSFMLLNGGEIIDADLVRKNPSEDRDGWKGIQPLVNISSSQATTNVDVENDGTDGQAAILESYGPDDLFDVIKPDVLVLSSAPLSVPPAAVDNDLPVQLTTDLYLTPYSNSIQMATKVQNTSGSALGYFMGDFINPGGQLEPFGPGQGYGETLLRNGGTTGSGGQSLDYLAFQGSRDSAGLTYGVIFPGTKAAPTRFTGAFASSGVFAWTTKTDLLATLIAPPASKGPGGFSVPAMGSNTLRRWFVVGKTVSDVTKARTELFQLPKAALQGIVTVGGAPVANAHVTLINDDVNYAANCPAPGDCVNVFSSTLTDDHGFYRFVVPEGTYQVAARKMGAPYEGSTAAPTLHSVELKKKKTLVQNIDLPGTGTVIVNATDAFTMGPIAAKVSIVGVQASPDPLNVEPYSTLTSFVGRYFGYNYEDKGDQFGLVDARFTELDGSTGAFPLEPGTYRVVVSHGYEFDTFDQQITVTAGNTTTVNATVHRVLDTTGFASIDAHVHMINSPDSTISRSRRILSMIAEGVDFFVNTDHDFIHSLTDDIADMGATGLVANAPSVETTTSHYGHFNSWPLTVDSGQLAGGAIDWSFHAGDMNGAGYPSNGAYDNTPGEIFALGLAYPGEQVIQINHFNSGTLGNFNMLGIDTAQDPPVSSNAVYRCVGGTYAGYPCQVKICLGGGNDGNACTSGGDCPGGTCNNPSGAIACPSGACMPAGASLASFLRMNPAATNLYDDSYTALELWIEAGRGQTDLLLGENMGDWFNLLNQGRFKAGTADSDTHSVISVQSGGPRTFVASSTDSPASIDPEELAHNVNQMRAIGSNAPFLRVSLENGGGSKASQDLAYPRTVAYSGGGADKINIHVESPTWAQYDEIDIYMNSVPSCKSEFTFFGVVNPSHCSTVTPTITLHAGTDFTVNQVGGLQGGQKLETDKTVNVNIAEDTWVVVVARGTDGVSKPLFPIEPQDLATTACAGGTNDGTPCSSNSTCTGGGTCSGALNGTLAALTDNNGPLPWNLGEDGALALAFSNPLFFDDGDNICHGGTACPGM